VSSTTDRPRALGRIANYVEIGTGQLRSDSRGFESLGELHEKFSKFVDADITLGLSKLEWLDSHMAGPMRVVVCHAEARGNVVIFARPRRGPEMVLRRNGLLPGGDLDEHRNAIPLRQFTLQEYLAFSRYAQQHLARAETPRMSDALTNKFYEGIDELFSNSALHSRSSQGVFVAGQFYQKQHRLSFTITDSGQGIPGAVRAAGHPMSDPKAVAWAMQNLHTTRQDDIPGLGLKILRDFIRLNGGKLVVASNGGFWCQNDHGLEILKLSSEFPGTAVMLEINTADTNRYDLAPPPDPRSIW
jgi:hypothetical protein